MESSGNIDVRSIQLEKFEIKMQTLWRNKNRENFIMYNHSFPRADKEIRDAKYAEIYKKYTRFLHILHFISRYPPSFFSFFMKYDNDY
jgi:hypothetical protein